MRRALGLALPLAALILAWWLWSHTEPGAPGVRVTRGLPAGCQVEHYTVQSGQPFRTVVLACPGEDALRLWPWPVQRPWHEDQYGDQLGVRGSLAGSAAKEGPPPARRFVVGFELALSLAQRKGEALHLSL